MKVTYALFKINLPVGMFKIKADKINAIIHTGLMKRDTRVFLGVLCPHMF